MQRKTNRVRPLLLVLLWIWAGTVLLVLDLFWNVDPLDGVRPRARLYRDARRVAHELVGEPLGYGEEEEPAPRRVARERPPAAASARPPSLPLARAGSRHEGGVPDLRTPQGEKLRRDLDAAATGARDPATRQAALRSLARMFGEGASGTLAAAAEDPEQPAEARDLAARLLREVEGTRQR